MPTLVRVMTKKLSLQSLKQTAAPCRWEFGVPKQCELEPNHYLAQGDGNPQESVQTTSVRAPAHTSSISNVIGVPAID